MSNEYIKYKPIDNRYVVCGNCAKVIQYTHSDLCGFDEVNSHDGGVLYVICPECKCRQVIGHVRVEYSMARGSSGGMYIDYEV